MSLSPPTPPRIAPEVKALLPARNKAGRARRPPASSPDDRAAAQPTLALFRRHAGSLTGPTHLRKPDRLAWRVHRKMPPSGDPYAPER